MHHIYFYVFIYIMNKRITLQNLLKTIVGIDKDFIDDFFLLFDIDRFV